MTAFHKVLLALCVIVALTTRAAEPRFVPLALEGQTFIHDPSTIIKEGTNYYIFGTGTGIRTKSSSNLIHWENGDAVFWTPPVWIKTFVPDFSRNGVWAPDIIRVNGRYFLYYAASTFGKQVSVIGLLTNVTLNPDAKAFHWSDAGPVIASTKGGPYNAIDPSVFLDRDRRLWLAFGSYWDGIFLTELNPQTGLRVATNSPVYHLAWNQSIEAACLTRHDDFYYLFVNWGQCCKGTNSTYEVRVGRSERITGPYRDRDGNDLATGGGSPFLDTNGRFIGPGHIGILNDGATNSPTIFSYHYYDAQSNGRSRLAIGKMDWSSGWPVAVSP